MRISERPRLFIDVQHGLCNRLRAMASAAAIAGRTGRDLVVIWCPDAHCAARLEDLLVYPGPVISDRTTADLHRRRAAHVYNYQEIEPGADYLAPILPHSGQWEGRDIYVRSAYTLVSPHLLFREEQQFLTGLVAAPAVRTLVGQVRHPNQVALHIRMSTGPGYDHLPHEAPDNWPAQRHDELRAWRANSQAERFIARLDQLIGEGLADTIFLAADLPETYEQFTDRYGDRVAMLPRKCFDRSARQLQYALADLMLLTAAPWFLASTGSSFSDIAQRLARPGRRIEKSGMDF